jgi:hypothetical protein
MVDSGPRLELTTHWFPTRASGERLFAMQIEYSLNGYPDLDHPSFVEIALTSGVDEALAALPSFLPKNVIREARRLLQPWPDGRYTDAYQRTGGILNLFTPPWGEQEDEVWAAMLAEWKVIAFADEGAGQEALQALEQRWNHTPHPFFAGLTPAQVMAGGGHEEAELSNEFLRHITEMFDGQPFESEGMMLNSTLMLLRGWSCQPREDGRTPLEIIVAERNELLARRERALKGEAE